MWSSMKLPINVLPNFLSHAVKDLDPKFVAFLKDEGFETSNLDE